MVVLPQPKGPNRETNSPSLTSKLMSDKTTVRSLAPRLRFIRIRRFIHPAVCGNDVRLEMKGGECVKHWPKGLYALSFCLEEISNWAGPC